MGKKGSRSKKPLKHSEKPIIATPAAAMPDENGREDLLAVFNSISEKMRVLNSTAKLDALKSEVSRNAGVVAYQNASGSSLVHLACLQWKSKKQKGVRDEQLIFLKSFINYLIDDYEADLDLQDHNHKTPLMLLHKNGGGALAENLSMIEHFREKIAQRATANVLTGSNGKKRHTKVSFDLKGEYITEYAEGDVKAAYQGVLEKQRERGDSLEEREVKGSFFPVRWNAPEFDKARADLESRFKLKIVIPLSWVPSKENPKAKCFLATVRLSCTADAFARIESAYKPSSGIRLAYDALRSDLIITQEIPKPAPSSLLALEGCLKAVIQQRDFDVDNTYEYVEGDLGKMLESMKKISPIFSNKKAAAEEASDSPNDAWDFIEKEECESNQSNGCRK